VTAKTCSSRSSYAGLLPIEPSDDFFRAIDLASEPIELKPEPIDLKPEPIHLEPEDVPFPNWQPSAGKYTRSLARFLIAFCTGVATTLLWQSYGDPARATIANLYSQLGWLAPWPERTAQNLHPADVIAPAARPAEQPNAMLSDLDAVEQNIEKIATTIAPAEEPTTRSTDEMATGQEQMIRNTDQTVARVSQNPAAEASGVTAESRPDAASLQPAARLTGEKPPQTLSERGKELSATSGHDASCFPSASAVLHNHPGGWPSWTLKAPGHEGTMCWYAAARPRGSDHRRERMPKEKEAVGTAEHELFAPITPYGRGGSWEGGPPGGGGSL
jgi:hypothetical protein